MIKLWQNRHYGWSYEVYVGGRWAAGGDFFETEQDAEARANEVLRWNDLMPDMTTHEAAEYLAAHGYTVGRRRAGGSGPPSGDTLKHWCKQGRFAGARKSGDRWLIPKEEIDKLLGPIG